MYLTIVVFAVMLTVASSGPIGEVTTQTASASERNINEAQLESYDGPTSRVAVYRFEDQSAKGGGGKSHKTGWYSKEIGNGMADMLNDALVRSNRFLVLDRQSL